MKMHHIRLDWCEQQEKTNKNQNICEEELDEKLPPIHLAEIMISGDIDGGQLIIWSLIWHHDVDKLDIFGIEYVDIPHNFPSSHALLLFRQPTFSIEFLMTCVCG